VSVRALVSARASPWEAQECADPGRIHASAAGSGPAQLPGHVVEECLQLAASGGVGSVVGQLEKLKGC
jgi:hypothetical protein